MKLHELKAAAGSRSTRSRKGRGMGSKGKTSGRGQKGQKARGKTRLGFEGGQMPLYRRIPKRGFTSMNRKQIVTVSLDKLNSFDSNAEVTPAVLVETGVVRNPKDGIKILGTGKLDKALTVKANQFSASAKTAIEAAGGKAEVI
ncbi:LSU ribosomal protein L15p (L27Ae) [Fructilactobacillus florum 8D]|uniref:Large ribosomal subunit protein uL15 n=2 Tax=Fructilactobacillus florum TaxID=640331 RepID=W9ELC2_9LACO|nr:50S ribosomal protein L15 [Fructilactobacillus florum]EKK20781.1 LSU ribosomal protein L15p (L27Ae) [Fructilactobacillus florum 2F]ETO40469.1 LSU ribosomal protein L15p (L27Ae) [Fructilactobacillus florum 8D]KRM91218.1 50S ribosomal protein L15 [Fructilactobacillus florum DSM 22689 = JCM 16035]